MTVRDSRNPPTSVDIRSAGDADLLSWHATFLTAGDTGVVRLIREELKARNIEIPLGPIG